MSYRNKTIDDLPELPLESLSLGGKLELSLTEPVLTIRAKNTAAPESQPPKSKPPTTLHCPSSSSHYIRKYLTQVTYPRVSCHPNNALTDTVVQQVLQERQNSSNENRMDQTTPSGQTQFYKLTSHKGEKLPNPYFCTVHNGPWSATVTESQGCLRDCKVPPISWRLSVAGMPDIDLTWEGTWQDIPVYNYANLSVIMGDLHLVEEGNECCDGFTFCSATNSCIPFSVPCHDTQPI